MGFYTVQTGTYGNNLVLGMYGHNQSYTASNYGIKAVRIA